MTQIFSHGTSYLFYKCLQVDISVYCPFRGLSSADNADDSDVAWGGQNQMSLDAKSLKLSSVINTSNRIYLYITSVKVRSNKQEGQASFEETKTESVTILQTTTKSYIGLEGDLHQFHKICRFFLNNIHDIISCRFNVQPQALSLPWPNERNNGVHLLVNMTAKMVFLTN